MSENSIPSPHQEPALYYDVKKDHIPLEKPLTQEELAARITQFIADSDESGIPFAYMLLDLNQFKAVNDTFGHNRGDEVLNDVSNGLRAALRGDDILRRGGDEFIVLIPLDPRTDLQERPEQPATEPNPFARADSVRERLHGWFEGYLEDKPSFKKVGLGVSIGFAIYDPHYDVKSTLEELTTIADQAMYAEKDYAHRKFKRQNWESLSRTRKALLWLGNKAVRRAGFSFTEAAKYLPEDRR